MLDTQRAGYLKGDVKMVSSKGSAAMWLIKAAVCHRSHPPRFPLFAYIAPAVRIHRTRVLIGNIGQRVAVFIVLTAPLPTDLGRAQQMENPAPLSPT
jgi:hypothetical protein